MRGFNETVGVLSDTHGLLRPAVAEALSSCELIIHAGDIGAGGILAALRAIAPVAAVRGNVDRGPVTAGLPEAALVAWAGRTILVMHNLERLRIDPRAAGIDIVVHGHSHRPSVRCRGGVLYLNPGSAGPKRFDLPVSMAYLAFEAGGTSAELLEIQGRKAVRGPRRRCPSVS